jgi:trehalose-6-phosphate synthase
LHRARSFGAQFLWPVLHRMHHKAIFNGADFLAYKEVNRTVGAFAAAQVGQASNPVVMIQDYQCTMMAAEIRRLLPKARLSWFLHTPWPAYVDQDVAIMVEVVFGILGNDVIGFQTAEDAENFLDFIEDHIIRARSLLFPVLPTVLRKPRTINIGERTISVVVAPIGLDVKGWEARAAKPLELPPEIMRKMDGTEFLCLSADRLDITKGQRDRLIAELRFFREHPGFIGKVVFAQAGANSRNNLGWQQYDLEEQAIDLAWYKLEEEHRGTRVTAFLKNLPPEILAKLYRRARVMIVNPWADGWNLTACEYVACQDEDNPGVLLLSAGAGCYSILRHGCLEVSPSRLNDLSQTIYRALTMELGERRVRMRQLKNAIAGRTIEDWIRDFGRPAGVIV